VFLCQKFSKICRSISNWAVIHVCQFFYKTKKNICTQNFRPLLLTSYLITYIYDQTIYQGQLEYAKNHQALFSEQNKCNCHKNVEKSNIYWRLVLMLHWSTSGWIPLSLLVVNDFCKNSTPTVYLQLHVCNIFLHIIPGFGNIWFRILLQNYSITTVDYSLLNITWNRCH